jgi:hypothetical protein
MFVPDLCSAYFTVPVPRVLINVFVQENRLEVLLWVNTDNGRKGQSVVYDVI